MPDQPVCRQAQQRHQHRHRQVHQQHAARPGRLGAAQQRLGPPEDQQMHQIERHDHGGHEPQAAQVLAPELVAQAALVRAHLAPLRQAAAPQRAGLAAWLVHVGGAARFDVRRHRS
jgi:hypothetical protein